MWNSHAAIQLLQPLVGTGAIEKNPTKEASVSLHPYAGGPVIYVGAIRSMLGLAAVGPRDERGGRGDDTREATMLFSERSLWTMIHGIALGGGSLLALAAALFALYLLSPREGEGGMMPDRSGAIAGLTSAAAVLLWLTTLVGTYVIFPPYRASPPEGITDLTAYPRSLILDEPSTAWLHTFAMETKEHLPFIASMLVTAVAVAAWRHRSRFLQDTGMRRTAVGLLGIAFAIVAYISLLGVFVNKVAPLV